MDDYDFDEYSGVFQKKVWEANLEVPHTKEQIREHNIINEYGGDFEDKQNKIISGESKTLETDKMARLALSCSSTSVVGDLTVLTYKLWQGSSF